MFKRFIRSFLTEFCQHLLFAALDILAQMLGQLRGQPAGVPGAA